MSCINQPVKHLVKKSSHRNTSFLINRKFIPRGRITLSGDKSIAHRALILSALSAGKTRLKNFPVHDDSLATLNALSALGVKILRKKDQVDVAGRSLVGLSAPGKPVFVNNSGTTLRLLLGVLAGMKFKTKIVAGKYLSARPMSRVNVPLRLMGAKISSRIKSREEYAPISIEGGHLKGIVYHLPVASAQVKSAVLLAGLFARGKTTVVERSATRDHTERMLKIFGADLQVRPHRITLNPTGILRGPGQIHIPGDISSAAFFMVLATIIPNSRIIIEHSSLNPSRIGVINVLKKMRAKIKVTVSKTNPRNNFEPAGRLIINSSKLKGITINQGQIPYLIDELPILMVAACFAQGKTVIKGAGELRVKETDRINSMVVNLKKMGADICVQESGGCENILINGQGKLKGAALKSFGDHRTAMSLVVAAFAAKGKSSLDDISCVSKSFPGFLKTLKSLQGKQ